VHVGHCRVSLASQRPQDRSLLAPHPQQIGIDGERMVHGGERLLIFTQLHYQFATSSLPVRYRFADGDPALSLIGIKRRRSLEVRERLVAAFEFQVERQMSRWRRGKRRGAWHGTSVPMSRTLALQGRERRPRPPQNCKADITICLPLAREGVEE